MEELFIKHQRTCPYCKSNKTWSVKVSGITRVHCSCGGEFTPKSPTPENIEKFKEFLGQCNGIVL